MPRFIVTIPAYTRVEEIYYIDAENAEAAIELAEYTEPNEVVQDNEYYDIRVDSASALMTH